MESYNKIVHTRRTSQAEPTHYVLLKRLTERPLLHADSTDRRNTLIESVSWCFEV